MAKKKATYANTQDFIDKFCKSHKLKICPQTRQVMLNGKIARNATVSLLKSYDSSSDKRNVKDKFLKLFFEDYIDTLKENIMHEKAKDLLTYKAGGTTELKKLANLIYDERKYPDLHTEFIIVMKYWLESLYHKLNGKTFVFPIIPIFYSRHAQGKGKSLLVKKILEPFSPFTMDTSIDQICDSRCYKMLSENWACNLDECRGASSDQIAYLKNIITSSTINPRILNSHTLPIVPVTTVFVGTGNEAISRILNDSSGMRRFHDFPIYNELTEDELNTIDMELIIRGHKMWTKKEAQEMRKYYDQYIQPKQDLIKKEDHVIEFIEMSELSWNKPRDGQHLSSCNTFVSSKDIFDNFVSYWSKQGLRKPPRRFKDFMVDLCEIIGQNEGRSATCWRGLYLSDQYRHNVITDATDTLRSHSSFYS